MERLTNGHVESVGRSTKIDATFSAARGGDYAMQ